MMDLHISPGQLTGTLTLRGNSALAGCTAVLADDVGVFIAPLWPGLSSGEMLLWRVMAWLNGADDLPSRADLEAGLDASNLAAALAAVGSGVAP